MKIVVDLTDLGHTVEALSGADVVAHLGEIPVGRMCRSEEPGDSHRTR